MSSRRFRSAGWSRVAAVAAGWLAGACTAALFASTESIPATASEPDSSRYADKALFVLELARFVEWPPARLAPDKSPFVVGVLDDRKFGAEIGRAAAGQRVRGHAIRVRNFRNLDEVEPCEILVIGPEKVRLLSIIVDFLSDTQGVLTVGEGEGFAEQGGVVRLVERPDRIAFEINRDAARAAGLQFSAQLLRLAERLVPETDGLGAP